MTGRKWRSAAALRAPVLLLAICAAAGGGGPLADQVAAQPWVVDLDAGRSSFQELPGMEPSTNAMLGLRRSADDGLLHAAFAAPLSSDDLLWAAVTARETVAFRRGRATVGVDLAGHGHGQRDPVTEVWGWGARGEALPMASISVGPVVGRVRSGGSLYHLDFGGEGWTRSLWTSDLRLSHPLRPGWTLSAEARHLRNSEEAYTFLGGSASGGGSRVGVQVSAGEWVSVAGTVADPDGDVPTTAWSAGAQVAVSPRATVRASVRREPFEPLSLATSRTSWGVGFSYRLGSGRSGPPSQGPRFRSPERVVLHLPLEASSSPPYVAGDFTGWEPVRMDRHGHQWRVEVPVEPGAHRYAFRRGEDEWFVPEGFPGRRDDGMGGATAVLVVP